MSKREYSLLDQFIHAIDQGLRVVTTTTPHSTRVNPAEKLMEPSLTLSEKKHVVGLLRVDHSGEVCAQALYQGQTLTTRSKNIREKLQRSAIEEQDHLCWCQERLNELGGKVSYLNPLWQLGAFTLGMLAGLAGDAWNLGFLVETEKQVVQHLQNHIQQLPVADIKSRKILEQMQQDEQQHAHMALESGAKELPNLIKQIMYLSSKFMTTLAYYI